MRSWQPVTSDEIFVVRRLTMSMGVVQTCTLKSYFSRDAVVETPIFPQTTTLDRFELITKFLNSIDKCRIDTYTADTYSQNSPATANAKQKF
jgi:hypothetical protein